MSAEEIRLALRCGRRGCECARPRGRVHCPGHPDEHPSLSVSEKGGRVLVHDFSGRCTQEEVIRALRDRGLWRGSVSSYPSVNPVTVLHPAPGLTLQELAAAKRLPLGLLEAAGCCNTRRKGTPAVRIPYPDQGGEVVAVRFRLSLSGGQRFAWRRGDHPVLYGLDRLSAIRAAGWCLLVEGESDTWTAWYYNLPVLGVPGKGTWRREWARYLDGLAVYLWQEPDAADFVERVARDLPGLCVIIPPEGTKDLSEAHLRGDDVPALVERLKTAARPAAELLREAQNALVADLRRRAAPVMEAADPLALVEAALVAGGYGGDRRPAVLTYLAATTRLLVMRGGAMPAHLILLGPPSAGKNYTVTAVLRLLPAEAYHAIDAGSPRVLIYDETDLRHRALIFGEADSLPAGEDNPAASAIRNLLQDHRLHYHVTIRDPETGDFTVRRVEKPGPTVLITTATRRLGEQLDSRLFCVDVPDDQAQVREALLMQASLETGGVAAPSEALVAYQGYLQALAPWSVVVPFAHELAEAIGRSPAASRVLRDYARLLALVKAVTILRHQRRRRDTAGRLVAEVADYAAVYDLVRDAYAASVTGAGQGVRDVVQAVAALKSEGKTRVSAAQVARYLGINNMAASRRVRAALRAGWLINEEPRKGRPYDLVVGEPLPAEDGLPRPEALRHNSIIRQTDENSATLLAASPGGGSDAERNASQAVHLDCGRYAGWMIRPSRGWRVASPPETVRQAVRAATARAGLAPRPVTGADVLRILGPVEVLKDELGLFPAGKRDP